VQACRGFTQSVALRITLTQPCARVRASALSQRARRSIRLAAAVLQPLVDPVDVSPVLSIISVVRPPTAVVISAPRSNARRRRLLVF